MCPQELRFLGLSMPGPPHLALIFARNPNITGCTPLATTRRNCGTILDSTTTTFSIQRESRMQIKCGIVINFMVSWAGCSGVLGEVKDKSVFRAIDYAASLPRYVETVAESWTWKPGLLTTNCERERMVVGRCASSSTILVRVDVSLL